MARSSVQALGGGDVTLNCRSVFEAMYVEKGMGLVIPGMTPDTLGEIYEYRPTLTEWSIAAGVFGVGFLVFTVLVKVAVPILSGQFQSGRAPAAAAGPSHLAARS